MKQIDCRVCSLARSKFLVAWLQIFGFGVANTEGISLALTLRESHSLSPRLGGRIYSSHRKYTQQREMKKRKEGWGVQKSTKSRTRGIRCNVCAREERALAMLPSQVTNTILLYPRRIQSLGYRDWPRDKLSKDMPVTGQGFLVKGTISVRFTAFSYRWGGKKNRETVTESSESSSL